MAYAKYGIFHERLKEKSKPLELAFEYYCFFYTIFLNLGTDLPILKPQNHEKDHPTFYPHLFPIFL
jgi:hypothetical protein